MIDTEKKSYSGVLKWDFASNRCSVFLHNLISFVCSKITNLPCGIAKCLIR